MVSCIFFLTRNWHGLPQKAAGIEVAVGADASRLIVNTHLSIEGL